ncbi:tail fiber protein [Variovorax humicola]|uniref:Tail fiber protein n=1 Tax=Variovorax humicola TaxID=1769758 RepID=A0ABU8VW76_9BURK
MDPILGSIQLFAFNFVPQNWMSCDGSLVQIRQYTAVFSLVGTTYGGDGMTTFGLPNLKGKEPVPGSIYCICMQGVFPSRP